MDRKGRKSKPIKGIYLIFLQDHSPSTHLQRVPSPGIFVVPALHPVIFCAQAAGVTTAFVKVTTKHTASTFSIERSIFFPLMILE